MPIYTFYNVELDENVINLHFLQTEEGKAESLV